ncbi:grpE protein homolog, mitochondrial isoform X4 [Bacillus rossius redtenbacheri]|uniref:grpE protein homolog, mitochondrial isoform X4 n=1 Tax=Bacillus rossius redtenbacheri TaxID=93214 RepID=UPI002FDED6FE
MASISIQTLRIGRMCLDNFVHVRSCTRVTPRWHLPHWGHLQRGASAAVSGEADSPQARPDEAKLQSEVDKLSKEIADLLEKDKYKRALADGENMRVRLTKQIEDAKLFGIQGFCKDLLEVADTLGKATESVPQEEVNDSNPHLKNLYEGLSMTEAQLQQVFRRHGLCQVNPLNEKFNPNLHEALFSQEVDGKEPGMVVVVSKVGYKLHERVIRPALVGVSK